MSAMPRLAASRRGAILMVVALLLLITLPALWSGWNGWRLDRTGVSTEGTVTKTSAVPETKPDRFFVRYYLPEDADPQRGQYIARVSREAWEQAKADESIEVHYLEG